MNDSPNSINTVNQIGNNNLTVNENAPKPELIIRKIKSLNTKVEGGYKHIYILTLSNPSNADINIAASASKNVDFKLLDFEYDTKYLVSDNGKMLTDLDAWVLTDKEISQTDINFVVSDK